MARVVQFLDERREPDDLKDLHRTGLSEHFITGAI